MTQTEKDQTKTWDNTAVNESGNPEESGGDKEFLRTEPLGKLLLKLALPTVAAQLINMLYNIVDRIYIGHIPDIGATALTGGRVYATDHDCFRVCGTGRLRQSSQSFDLYGSNVPLRHTDRMPDDLQRTGSNVYCDPVCHPV